MTEIALRMQLVYEPFNYTYVASPPSILDGQTNPGNGLPWSKMSAKKPARS